MTEDQQIEHLKTAPLVVPLTRRERIWDVVQRVCAVISVVSLAVAVVGIALVFQLAVCTNTNLGKRSAPSANDAKAHIAFAVADQRLTDAQAGLNKSNKLIRAALAEAVTAKTVDAQAKATSDFVTAFIASGPAAMAVDAATDAKSAAETVYVATLNADQSARDDHPLGKC